VGEPVPAGGALSGRSGADPAGPAGSGRTVARRPRPPRVALLEDQLAVAQALALLLTGTPGLDFVGHAATEPALADLLEQTPADVLMIDDDLDGADGVEIGDRVLRRWPGTRLVMLAAATDETRLAAAIRIGAVGWVTKTAEPAALIAIVHGAHRDETHMPPAALTGALRRIAGEPGPDAPPGGDALTRLTPRERDVLQEMLRGRSRADIAGRLGMSPNTVRTHVQNILRALNVDSAAAAVALARRIGRPATERSGDGPR